MIEIKCLEKGKNNPYKISNIYLWKEDNIHYISFKCETEEIARFFWSYIDRLRDSIKVERMQVGFSLVNKKEEHDNTVVMKGDISEAIKVLVTQGILRNSNKTLFYDDEEEEIKKFLMENKESTIIKKSNKNRIIEENNAKTRNCNIV